MKALITFLVVLFFAAPVWAVDVSMGAGGNLVFEPNEITISAGDTVHFIMKHYLLTILLLRHVLISQEKHYCLLLEKHKMLYLLTQETITSSVVLTRAQV